MKKLTDPQTSTALFFERVSQLGEKLGPILFQLPPRWRANLARLDAFLGAMPADYRFAFEFREPSWLNPDVYAVLRRHRAALCFYYFNGQLAPLELTADFVYIRLHGPGGPYQGSYSPEDLLQWSEAIRTWTGQGIQAYAYFDNDMAGYAPKNAALLAKILNERIV